MNILHIMTHMGGGVGHAVSDLVLQDKKNVNRIVLLQKPEKLKYIDRCVKNGIEVIVESSIGRITNLIKGGGGERGRYSSLVASSCYV